MPITAIKYKTERAALKVCWCIPQLPSAEKFRRWLPKHRHILFGHFGYWIIACLLSASYGTSLRTTCTKSESTLIFVALLVISVVVSIPKLLSDKIKKSIGPAILSFMMMLSTGLSLHQKPLICGFAPKLIKIRANKAKMWGVVVAIQIMNLSVAMLAYLIWHLKHKDEVRAAQQAEEASDEDSMAASLPSIDWHKASREPDIESNNSKI